MPDQSKPQDNTNRLLRHLKDESLAARIVRSHRECDGDNSDAAMQAVIDERLEQARAKIEGTTD